MSGGICLVVGLLLAPLGETVTLLWTHSIEKIIWEEDYLLEKQTLHLVAARVRGTGAGMEPPASAVLRDGAWHYAPQLPPLPRVALRHSPYAAPYVFCAADGCRTETERLPGLPEETIMELLPCASVAPHAGAAAAH